jgi:uncharacterized membrane protein YfcA
MSAAISAYIGANLGPLLLSGLVVLITHAAEAVTGFGCTVLAVPFVTAILSISRGAQGFKEGIQILTIIAWILGLYMAISKHKKIVWKHLALICLLMLPGLILGQYLFSKVDTTILKKILAVFIIVVAAWQLTAKLREKRNAPPPQPPKGKKLIPYIILLLVGGVVHGMFSSGGPLVVLYASRALPDKGNFRATLCTLWATLNTIIIINYIRSGSLGLPSLTGTGFMLPFLFVGIVAGEIIHNKVNAWLFACLVFAMLLITGVFMLVL